MQKLEISDKKYILYKDLEFYHKKIVQSNKMVIPNKDIQPRWNWELSHKKIIQTKNKGFITMKTIVTIF